MHLENIQINISKKYFIKSILLKVFLDIINLLKNIKKNIKKIFIKSNPVPKATVN
jgi:hypothetical protein